MTCKVRECRFSDSHVTLGHKCGTCNKYGHGQLECSDECDIHELYESTKDDELKTKDQCTSTDCKHAKYHKNHGHYCDDCKSFHIKQLCKKHITKTTKQAKILYSITCPHCKVTSIITTANKSTLNIHTDSQCSICTDNEVNICLPCKCAKICNKCLDVMKKKN